MESVVEQGKRKLRDWVGKHPNAVLYDEEKSALLDIASGKSTHLRWGEVKAFQEKIHPETQDTYLIFLFQNEKQLALVDPGGVAFAPSTENTGAIPNLPPVVCLKDFFTLKSRIDHYLYDHPDEPPPKQALDLVIICLAMLDGARAAGFDVGDLEEGLDKSLRELERRAS